MSKTAAFVYQRSNATGTGNLEMVSAAGFRTFATAFPSNNGANPFFYCIRDKSSGEYENGQGYLDGSGFLVRATVLESSNGGSHVDFAANLKDITCDVPAIYQENIPNVQEPFTSAEKSKLAGIQAGATLNQSDAYLLDRANHTGTQAIATVSGLQTALDAKAPLASPSLTGTPTTPTATLGTSTQIANLAYVDLANTALMARIINLYGGFYTKPTDFRWDYTTMFQIFRNDADGKYYTTFDKETLKPQGQTYWISKTGNDSTGDGSQGNPYRTLAKADAMGAVVFMIGTGIWDRTDGFASSWNPARSVRLVSADGAGKAIITRAQTGLTWTQQASPNNNVYAATVSNAVTVLDLAAAGWVAYTDPNTGEQYPAELLEDGIRVRPKAFTNQTSIAACQANVHANWWFGDGSWYLTGGTLYVRTFDGRAPDANVLVLRDESIMAAVGNNITVYNEGVIMWGNSGHRLTCTGTNTSVLAGENFSISFSSSTGANGMHTDANTLSWHENVTITDIFRRDAFNYTNTLRGSGVPYSKGVEISCKSRRIGGSLPAETTLNGSTSHNDCTIIRLNCDHRYNQGPTVADVSGAHSINENVTAGYSYVASNIAAKTGFQAGGTSAYGLGVTRMYVGQCTTKAGYYDLSQDTGAVLKNEGFNNFANNRNYGTIVT